MAIMDADGGGGVELDEFQEWCEYSMDPKFDQSSIDAFERQLAKVGSYVCCSLLRNNCNLSDVSGNAARKGANEHQR